MNLKLFTITMVNYYLLHTMKLKKKLDSFYTIYTTNLIVLKVINNNI